MAEDKKVTQMTPYTSMESTDLVPFIRTSEPDQDKQNGYIAYAELKNELLYPTVNVFADLPAAASHPMEIYIVLNGSGIYMVNRKSAGMYYSDGATWKRLGNIPAYFDDLNLRFYNNLDNTKELGWNLASIDTATLRTITAPNRDLDLNAPIFESLTVENTGNAVITQSNTTENTNFTHTLSAEMDFLLLKLTGAAITDWRGVPLDGTSPSTFRFGISTPTNGTLSLVVYDNNSSNIQSQLASSNTDSFVAANGGNFGVGTTTPSEKLDVNGNIAVSGTVDGVDLSNFEQLSRLYGSNNLFQGDVLENAVGSNWPITRVANAEVDTANTSLIVRLFDDTQEWGVGLTVFIPTGATSIKVRFLSRSYNASTGTVIPKLYTRQFDDAVNLPAWDAGTNLTAVDMTSNQAWHYDEQTITLASLGLDAGKTTIFELTRDGGTMTGFWALHSSWIEFE